MKKLFDDPRFYDPRELLGREECEGYGTAPKYEGGGEIKVVALTILLSSSKFPTLTSIINECVREKSQSQYVCPFLFP